MPFKENTADLVCRMSGVGKAPSIGDVVQGTASYATYALRACYGWCNIYLCSLNNWNVAQNIVSSFH